MAKFKANDRVRNIDPNDEHIKFGATGTVVENDSTIPNIRWDADMMVSMQYEENLEPLDPSEDTHEAAEQPNHFSDISKMDEPSGNIGESSVPKKDTLEWWRWHFSGQAMQGFLSNTSVIEAIAQTRGPEDAPRAISKDAIEQAETLISELTKQDKNNLISAAHDLLDALQKLVHLHLCEQEGISSGMPSKEQWIEAVDEATKAIQKAQGGMQ